MSDVDDFLAEVLPRHHEAGERMHNGDAGLWLEMWSNHDPATVFGALGVAPEGADQVAQNFREVTRRFSDGRDFRLEVIAAGVSGDLAYNVGYESSTGVLGSGSGWAEPDPRDSCLSTRRRRMEDGPPSRE